ncbi:MAG: peptidase domain-containing ABC transporter [Bacteroidales bacterium]
MGIKIRQRDITDCGAACLASVAEYYKLRIPVARIRQLAGTDKKGTNALGMIKGAEKLGFNAKGVKGPIEALKDIPVPAIAHIIINKTLQHYVVIYKVTDKTIVYMDPADGNLHSCEHSKFAEIWTNILILLTPNETFKSRSEKTSNLSRFINLIAPHKMVLIQCVFGAMIYTILGLSTSIYIGKITDYVIIGGNTNLLNLMSIGMIVILIIRIFIGTTQSLFMLNTGQLIDVRLILGYYKHLFNLPQSFFDTMRVGEIISRINDAFKIRVFINDVAISIIVNILVLLFSFSLMFIYSWKLALVMLAIIPIYIGIYTTANYLNKKQERKVMERSAELESQLVESLNAVRTIKEFNVSDFENWKTESRFVKLLNTVYRSSVNNISINSFGSFFNILFTIIILWFGANLVIAHEITAGTLLSFYAIIGYFTNPVEQLIGSNKTIQNALIAADRLFEILDLESESSDGDVDLTPEMFDNIIFNNVSFAYNSRSSVFENLCLCIKKGHVTAIIGDSGSGKTTLAALILKLYPITNGQIYIGNKNIAYLKSKSLRNLIATVPQQIDLFSGSIVENIALGEYNPEISRILSICKELDLVSFIETLPNGFNTYIGEHGAGLSGGQKQRIAIARALYCNPELLILDEATSALDSHSESIVQSVIEKLKSEGKTILIIAHRLSTVMNSDKIIILKNGTVVEEGNHSDLYKKDSEYFKLWQKQIPTINNKEF